MSFINFKPMLAPNNKADGREINWDLRLRNPERWFVSEKLDGIRIEIFFRKDGSVSIKTRAMKPFKSEFIKKLKFNLSNRIFEDLLLEGEIYSPTLNFSQLQHYISSINVASKESVKKHFKLWEKSNQGKKLDSKGEPIWKLGNLNLQQAVSYPKDLEIHFFDCYNPNCPNQMFSQRLDKLKQTLSFLKRTYKFENLFIISQSSYPTIEQIKSKYKHVIDSGGEGLIIKRKTSIYKKNRATLKECSLFKMKDEMREYFGDIIDVLEGTRVMDGIPTTIDEMGHSRTSKSKFDREPSGLAKGFLVALQNGGGRLVVTLKGYNNVDKANLLKENVKNTMIGKTIKFIASPPTKPGGLPRHAKYIK